MSAHTSLRSASTASTVEKSTAASSSVRMKASELLGLLLTVYLVMNGNGR